MLPYLLLPTEDGSLSCLDAATQELFHNRAGAYTEALKNYAEPATVAQPDWHTAEPVVLRLLDPSFGLGYNTWVLLAEIFAQNLLPPDSSIHVLGVELDIQLRILWPFILENPRLLTLAPIQEALEHNIYYQTQNFLQLSSTVGGYRLEFDFYFGDLRTIVPRLQGPFDLVFHDAFSPAKVPELWTIDLLRHYHRLLSPKQGRLLTYSAAGAVRGGLLKAGFEVYRTQSVGGKSAGGTLACAREWTEAQRQSAGSILQPLTIEERHRLVTGAKGIPYRDETFRADRDFIRQRRLEEQKIASPVLRV